MWKWLNKCMRSTGKNLRSSDFFFSSSMQLVVITIVTLNIVALSCSSCKLIVTHSHESVITHTPSQKLQYLLILGNFFKFVCISIMCRLLHNPHILTLYDTRNRCYDNYYYIFYCHYSIILTNNIIYGHTLYI